MRKLSTLLLMIAVSLVAPNILADDPPPGTVRRADYLRPCLNNNKMATAEYEYKCTEVESNVGVYHFFTRREYVKDAVYRVERTKIPRSEFVAFAVKQKTEVSRPEEIDDAVALVYQRPVPPPDPPALPPSNQWTYKKKE